MTKPIFNWIPQLRTSQELSNARYFPCHFMPEGVLITWHQAKWYLKFSLHQNFSLSGLRVSIADFGFEGPSLNSIHTNIFIKKKRRYSWDLNTGPLVPKSAMLAPRPQIDEKCLKNQEIWLHIFKFKILKIFGNELWNSFFLNVKETWNYIVIKFSAM